jgi:hypothetical protein
MSFKYNPVNGLRDAVNFPSKPPGGTGAGSARDQVQDMLDQARDNMNDYLNYVTDTGAANAYVVTLDPAPATYPLMLQMKATNANTGASTINPNGLGAKTIKKNVNVDLAAGDIPAGGIASLVYDGTYYQLINAADLATHKTDTTNPHAVTKAQVGLSNVTNAAQMPLTGGTFTGNVALGSSAFTPFSPSFLLSFYYYDSAGTAKGIALESDYGGNLTLFDSTFAAYPVWHGGRSGPFYKGAGSPEGAVTAPAGAIYQRTDGGASTTLYVKQSGTGNTGWVAK